MPYRFLTQEEVDNKPFPPKGFPGLFVLCYDKSFSDPNRQVIGYVIQDAQAASKVGRKDVDSFTVLAPAVDETGVKIGKVVGFKKDNGTNCYVVITNNEMFDPSVVAKKLHDAGCYVKNDPKVHEAISEVIINASFASASDAILVSDKNGYSDTLHGFVTADGLISKADEPAMVLSTSPAGGEIAKLTSPQGTREGWDEHIGQVALANPSTLFFVIFALYTILTQFVKDIGTTIFHISGKTTTGKTTGAQIAMSVIGAAADPRVTANQPTLIKSWLGTSNGISAMLSDWALKFLVMDELGLCKDKKQVDNMIYVICGGMIKTRSKGDGTASSTSGKSYNVQILSTGEYTFQSYLEKLGAWSGGQGVRAIEMVIDTIFHGESTQKTARTVRGIKTKCTEHYGHVGRAFMKALIDFFNDAKEMNEYIEAELDDSLNAIVTDEHSATDQRVLTQFALMMVAGNLAADLGVLDITRERVADAVQWAIDAWQKGVRANLSGVQPTAANADDFIQMLRADILERSGKYPDRQAKIARTCDGYQTEHAGVSVYLLKSETFERIFKGYDLDKVAQELVDAGVLMRDKDQFKRKHNIRSIPGDSPSGAALRFYTLDAAFMDDVDDTSTVSVPADDYQQFLLWQQMKSDVAAID